MAIKNIYLDTETTDKNPGQIVQLSYIIEEDNKDIIAKNFFFKVDDMCEEAYNVHNISVDDSARLSNGKVFKDHYEEILGDLSGGRIVAHNESFDEGFICSELWRCGVSFAPTDKLCTMKLWQDELKIPAVGWALRYGRYKAPKLSEVISRLNINTKAVNIYCDMLFNGGQGEYHDARFDTTALFVAVNIQRNMKSGNTDWVTTFCI